MSLSPSRIASAAPREKVATRYGRSGISRVHRGTELRSV
jgi:hypothetical protein